MRTRVLLLFAALAVLQSAGCCRRCCGDRDRSLPLRDTLRQEGPPPAVLPPAVTPRPTGAYGGS